MFIGEFEHSLDAKGRLILPVKFRDRLARLVVFKGRDGCVYLLPSDDFGTLSERLKEIGGKARDLQRVVYGSASEQLIDRQGRMAIPETLRRYAELQRDVTVIGAGDRVEIWDRGRWAARVPQMDETFAEFGEAHPDLPI